MFGARFEGAHGTSDTHRHPVGMTTGLRTMLVGCGAVPDPGPRARGADPFRSPW